MPKSMLHPSDNKIGAKSVIGAGYSVAADRYYSLITARWSTVIIVMAALYFGTALVFAVLVHIDPSASGGVSDLGTADSQGRFGDAFFYSVQALSTIGYGSLSPETDYTNMVTNFGWSPAWPRKLAETSRLTWSTSTLTSEHFVFHFLKFHSGGISFRLL